MPVTDAAARPLSWSDSAILRFFASGGGGCPLLASILSCKRRGRKALPSPVFDTLATASDELAHSSNDGRRLGSYAVSLFANGLKRLSSFLNLSRKYRITRPHDHRSALIGLYIASFSISGASQFSVPHWSSTSSSSSFTCTARSKS